MSDDRIPYGMTWDDYYRNRPEPSGREHVERKKESGADAIQAAIEAESERARRQNAQIDGLIARRTKPRRPISDKLREIQDDMADAFSVQLGATPPENDNAYRWVGMSFREMIRTLLDLRGVRSERYEPEAQLYIRAIATGDVPALLTGAGNRRLTTAYQSYTGGLINVCQRVRSRDFRPVKSISVDGEIALQEVGEQGELKDGTLKASAETFTPSTFGRLLHWTPTLFTNDDLDSFANLMDQLARSSAEFVSGKLATLLESNPTLSDSVAVFHGNHGNLGTGGALSETTLAELLKLVRNQTGPNGERIAAVPRAVVCPPALEFTANKLIALLGNPRPYDVIVEPRLSSATAFYIACDPASVNGIAYTYPANSNGPRIEVGRLPNFRGLGARISLDFGCGWVDHRGWAKNVGA